MDLEKAYEMSTSDRAKKPDKDKPTIFLAMPNMGMISTGNMINVLHWFGSGKYQMLLYALERAQPWDIARNICHARYLDTCNHEYMLWLDARTIPQAGWLDKMLEADKDVVCGISQTVKNAYKNGAPFPALVPVAMRWDEENKGYKPFVASKQGPVEVDIGTCSFCLVKRKVMEQVERPAFKFVYQDEYGTRVLGEDFYFFEKIREAGFKVYAYYGMVCQHWVKLDTRMVNEMLLALAEGKRTEVSSEAAADFLEKIAHHGDANLIDSMTARLQEIKKQRGDVK